jgi:hypothetical protein
LDVVEPEEFHENVETGIEQAERYGVLEQYQVLDGGVLIAVDAESSDKKSYEEQKQDGERKAVKRLLEKHGEYYKGLKATLLGDDLYANGGVRPRPLEDREREQQCPQKRWMPLGA